MMNKCPNNWSFDEINEKFAGSKSLEEKNICNNCPYNLYDNGLMMCSLISGGVNL